MAIAMQGVCPLLQVFDMPTALRFYRDRLGFNVVERSGADDDCGWARLRGGDAELMLNTAYDVGERPPERDGARQAAHGDVILYIGCADVDGAYAELRALGCEVAPPRVAPYGMKQLALRDPDGYALCLQAPVARTTT